MDYSNIFNYYRGQSRNENEAFVGTNQIENNVKKAFINVLEHSNELLTKNFIHSFIDNKNECHTFNYDYEVGSKLIKATPRALVVGIAESIDLVESTSDVKKRTRPDAAIITDSISILIETKTGDDRLNLPQLEGHKKSFANSQMIDEDIKLLEWSKIKEFINEQQAYFKSVNDMKTSFLLEQFEQFCDNNSVGFPNKSKEYIYSLFKTPRARELAKEIDDYLYFDSHYKDEVQDSHERYNKVRTDCIGYVSSKGKDKFATLTDKRKVCFVLHLGKKLHTQRAEVMQEEIDNLLNHKYADTDSSKHTAGEVYIRLEWVESLRQIKPFIDEAYNLRLKK